MSSGGWHVYVTYLPEAMEWVIDVLAPDAVEFTRLYHRNWGPPADQRATQEHIADQMVALDAMLAGRQRRFAWGPGIGALGNPMHVDIDAEMRALQGLHGTVRDPHPAVPRWVKASEPWQGFEVPPPIDPPRT